MIANKKILLVCKETFSYPMFFLGKELEKNNEVHYFFIHNSEVINKDSFNTNTYFYFKKNINNNFIHDVNDLNIKFLANKKNIKIDLSRLKEIENKYTNFSNLNTQLLSSQLTSTTYHDRFFFPPPNYNESIYWLILNYDKCENLLDTIKPNCIFDLDTGDLPRTIINEIANYKNIMYVNLDHSRYKSYLLPLFSLGRNVDEYFINTFNNIKTKNETVLNDYFHEIDEYRSQQKIMPKIYDGQITSKYDYSFSETIKFIFLKIYGFFRDRIKSYLYDKIKIPLDTPLYSNPYKRIFFSIVKPLRSYFLYSKFNKYFELPEDEKYIYMPLHQIPESSTYISAPMYVNEISLIETISKLLPISWKLYVKEHQSMIGKRNLEFYKKIKTLHNVKIVQSNLYKDPKPWIEKSIGVITITGTTAFEASMLNKPAIVFGEAFYNVISGIKIANNFKNLENLFKLIENNNWQNDNKIDCAKYIKTVKEVGVDLNLRLLMDLSFKKITSKILSKDEEMNFDENIKKLIKFYEKSFELYKINKKTGT